MLQYTAAVFSPSVSRCLFWKVKRFEYQSPISLSKCNVLVWLLIASSVMPLPHPPPTSWLTWCFKWMNHVCYGWAASNKKKALSIIQFSSLLCIKEGSGWEGALRRAPRHLQPGGCLPPLPLPQQYGPKEELTPSPGVLAAVLLLCL